MLRAWEPPDQGRWNQRIWLAPVHRVADIIDHLPVWFLRSGVRLPAGVPDDEDQIKDAAVKWPGAELVVLCSSFSPDCIKGREMPRADRNTGRMARPPQASKYCSKRDSNELTTEMAGDPAEQQRSRMALATFRRRAWAQT